MSAPVQEKPVSVFDKLVYPISLLASLSVWLLALRAPLWLDETLAYWQVSGGFAKVWSRSALMPSSIGYLYTLWATKSMFGSSEIALKLPSLFALLAAVYFLFRSARELFGEETAFLASIFFAIQNNIVFAATDARPYAFALLATTLAIFAFVRWMNQHQMRQAVLFGAAAAGILYFHYLFATILPAFAIYYLVARWHSIREDLRQVAAAVGVFVLLVAPLLYRVASLYHTRETHIVHPMLHPFLMALNNLAPLQLLIGFVAIAFLAALVREIKLSDAGGYPKVLLFPLLALVPAAVLTTLSAATPMNLIIPRYFSVVAPGSALTWAWLTGRIDSRLLRIILGAGLAAATCLEAYSSPASRTHELTLKQANAFVNSNVAPDDAPVLVFSAFIESDYEPLPTVPKSENALLSQIDYYQLNPPWVFLPIDLNERTMEIAREAALVAAQRNRRFLAVVPPSSYPSLQWLANYTRGSFTSRMLAEFESGATVVEFRPIAGSD